MNFAEFVFAAHGLWFALIFFYLLIRGMPSNVGMGEEEEPGESKYEDGGRSKYEDES
jgi:hypothetical protein